LVDSSGLPNLKSLTSAVAEILKENPNILGAAVAEANIKVSSWRDFVVGLDKPQLHAKFEVTGFFYYGNIRQFFFKLE